MICSRLCGGIYIGDPESVVVTGSLEAAMVHHLPHEVLDAAEIRARFPTMHPPDHAVGLYEPNAGYVRPEETVLANVELARRHGARLHFHEPVSQWTTTPGGVVVVTSNASYEADRLVLAPGAWARAAACDAGPDRRRAPGLLLVRAGLHRRGPLPGLRRGTPDLHRGDRRERAALRLSDGGRAGRRTEACLLPPERRHHHAADHRPDGASGRGRGDAPAGPATVPRLDGTAGQSGHLHVRLGAGQPLRDRQAERHPQVVLACGFSGHGFKFVPVVGQIIADLVQTGSTAYDLTMFDIYRPSFLGAP